MLTNMRFNRNTGHFEPHNRNMENKLGVEFKVDYRSLQTLQEFLNKTNKREKVRRDVPMKRQWLIQGQGSAVEEHD
jgi:hypothetical protein